MTLPLRLLPIAVLALTACVVSIDPIVPEEAAEFDPGLLGLWEEVDGSDRAVVAAGPGATYDIRYTTDDGIGTLRARLGRLGDHRIMDVWAEPAEDEIPVPYHAFMISGHIMALVQRSGPNEIRLGMLEPGPMREALRSGALDLVHSEAGEGLVLHGPTAELRAALEAYLDRPGAVAEPDVWRRVGENEAPRPNRIIPTCDDDPARARELRRRVAL